MEYAHTPCVDCELTLSMTNVGCRNESCFACCHLSPRTGPSIDWSLSSVLKEFSSCFLNPQLPEILLFAWVQLLPVFLRNYSVYINVSSHYCAAAHIVVVLTTLAARQRAQPYSHCIWGCICPVWRVAIISGNTIATPSATGAQLCETSAMKNRSHVYKRRKSKSAWRTERFSEHQQCQKLF